MTTVDNKFDDLELMFLEHYGVLGMKWGIRKQPNGGFAKTGSARDNSSGYEPKKPGKQSKSNSTPKKSGKASLRSYSKTRKTPKADSTSSNDHAKARQLSTKSVSELSNSDLKTLNERLNLEANYSRLTTKDRNAAAKFTTDVLKEVGKEMSKDVVRKGAKSAGKYLADQLKRK